MNQNKVIETELWEPVPDKPYQVRFVKTRTAYEVFKELEATMKANNMMPDEYFLLSHRIDEKSLMPKDASFIAYAQWGGNEGVYLEVKMISSDGQQHFATGKTLGETEEDYDRMQAIAGFIYKSFAGFGRVNRAVEENGDSDNVDRFSIAKQVDIESFKEDLKGIYNVDLEDVSDEEIAEMYDDLGGVLANNDEYAKIYNDAVWQVLKDHDIKN